MGLGLFFDAVDGDGALPYQSGDGANGGQNRKEDGTNHADGQRELHHGFLIFILDGDMANVALSDEIFDGLDQIFSGDFDGFFGSL